MNLVADLATLEVSGLIQPVVAGAGVEYRFRHALVHDAAYSTLLKQQRRELHRAVGEVLESAAGPLPGDAAPQLGYHFYEAGELERARRYFTQAAEQAAVKYAHVEAITYYTRAIQAIGPAPAAPPPALWHARGQVYEVQGNFEAARSDFERATEAARAVGDQVCEWQALLSLGLLWAGRDYERSGEYCQMALDLAQKRGQPALVARSYNRLGNWHLNVDRPREAATYHGQALSIFQDIGDESGIAETLDLLGMSSSLGGELGRAARFYERAIDLNRRLGNRAALATCLGSQLFTAAAVAQTMILTPSPLATRDLTAQGEEAVRMMHEIGWRDGEAFVNMILSAYSLARGDFSKALAASGSGLAIATDIGHRQWMAGNLHARANIYLGLLALPRAIELLLTGLSISREIGSRHWTRCHIGTLALAHLEYGQESEAGSLLQAANDIRQPPQTVGERLVTYAQAKLAHARGERAQALAIVASLTAAAEPPTPGQATTAIPVLCLLRGTLYAELAKPGPAEADFRAGIASAAAQGQTPLLWQLHAALGKLLQNLERTGEAAEQLGQARAVVTALAAGVPDATLRDNFLKQVDRRL
jgi:tetratricopeptide (TPR) repeat protein